MIHNEAFKSVHNTVLFKKNKKEAASFCFETAPIKVFILYSL